MLHVSWTPRIMKLSFILALSWSYSNRIRRKPSNRRILGSPRTNAQLGDSAAFVILIAVYALIVFELVHRALAAAIGGIAVVVALHIVGDGPDLGTVVTWMMKALGLLIGMMVIVDVLAKTGLFEWAAVQAYALSGAQFGGFRLSYAPPTYCLLRFLRQRDYDSTDRSRDDPDIKSP